MSEELTLFHAALLTNDATLLLPLLQPHPRLSGAQQFGVYAHAYRQRLVDAIASDYPLTRDLLGGDAFDAAALAYAEENVPTSYHLDTYPHPFGVWFDHHIADPFAGELARMEAAIAEVFMLPDSAPLAADDFARLTPESFGAQLLVMRTALRFMECHYPTHEWVNAARAGVQPPPRPAPQISYVLLVRHRNAVQRLALEEAEYALLRALASGLTVEQALDAVVAEDVRHLPVVAAHVHAWFSAWVSNGVFAAA